MIRYIIPLLTFLVLMSCRETPINMPNVIIIYLDDLGYGDLSCYGANEIHTPNIDRLAEEGRKFTNAYASSATCTPSRYALLTGTYPWRKKAKILPGTAPLIIDTSRMTLPKMLQKSGYHTAVIGKWHLGLGSGNVDWNSKISPGPNEVGFDHSYVMAATQDRVPTVYIENGFVDGLDPSDPILVDYKKNFEGEPTGKDNPDLLRLNWHHGHNSSIVNGIPRIGYMKGGEAAKWKDEDMADHFLGKVKEYIKSHREEPFFLYYGMQQPHVPRTPHERFIGSTDLGPRGDVIVEADWCVGELMKVLKDVGLLDNTMIILSSDNGPVLNDGYYDQSDKRSANHDPNGGLRGGKYSLFEAGTRVPFIVFWKDEVISGESDALISQLDILPSLAKLLDTKQPESDGLDLMDVILGNSEKGRDHIVLEATTRTSYREGDWVLIPPYNGPEVNKLVNIELGNSDEYLLYNLSEDPSQQYNLAVKKPAKLQAMLKNFKEIRGDEFDEIDQLELK